MRMLFLIFQDRINASHYRQTLAVMDKKNRVDTISPDSVELQPDPTTPDLFTRLVLCGPLKVIRTN